MVRIVLTATVLMATLLLSMPSSAQNLEAYQFDEPAQEAIFKELINELRCPKCQNQSIADSNAELARDLRDRTYFMVKEGATKQEVIDFMVARYGDFVHYQPPVTFVTSILWWGPIVVVAIGGLVIVFRVRQQRSAEVELSDEERQRLAALQSQANKDEER
ncbi:cystathionine gamma-synthase [Pseudidiomarina homiensis]|uniref:Cytochrome c-type biogenesis protein n=1 Tax=Pseudidiomarina homiensis TaxID=364198 RepID=A0A432Y7M1_9GAMM|nr:cystathionine gamma-synthase [Pseudidiomarina homiensis]